MNELFAEVGCASFVCRIRTANRSLWNSLCRDRAGPSRCRFLLTCATGAVSWPGLPARPRLFRRKLDPWRCSCCREPAPQTHGTRAARPPCHRHSPTLDVFPPFVASAEWLSAATVPLPRHSAPNASLDELLEDDEYVGLLTGALTLERARRILGVAADSTRDQIKAAYRQLASRYHPDRHTAESDEQRRLATERMASINEAYRLLCALQPDPLA